MQITQLAIRLALYVSLVNAGPVNRDTVRRSFERRAPYHNDTTTTASSIMSPITIEPLPYTVTSSLESGHATTMPMTMLVGASAALTPSSSAISSSRLSMTEELQTRTVSSSNLLQSTSTVLPLLSTSSISSSHTLASTNMEASPTHTTTSSRAAQSSTIVILSSQSSPTGTSSSFLASTATSPYLSSSVVPATTSFISASLVTPAGFLLTSSTATPHLNTSSAVSYVMQSFTPISSSSPALPSSSAKSLATGLEPLSSTIAPLSISQHYTLLNTSTIVMPTATTFPTVATATAVIVTDTFLPSSAPPTMTPGVKSTMFTIVMPSESSSTIVASSPTGLRSTLSLPLVLTSVSSKPVITVGPASSIAFVPTIMSALPTTATSISPAQSSANLAEAQGYNNLFSTLSPSSTCTNGQIACIDGDTGNCDASGHYVLSQCASGSKCFALPMINTAGVSVGCQDEASANAILGLTSTLSLTTPPTGSVQPSSHVSVNTVSVVTSKAITFVPMIQTSIPQVPSPSLQHVTTLDPIASTPTRAATSEESSSTSTTTIHRTSIMTIYLSKSTPNAVPSSSTPVIITTTTPVRPGQITIMPLQALGSGVSIFTLTVTTTEHDTVTTTTTARP